MAKEGALGNKILFLDLGAGYTEREEEEQRLSLC